MTRRVALGLSFALGLGCLAHAARAIADDTNAELPVQVHGFVSQGFIKTTANNYLAESKRGSFEFTEVGVNFSKDLSDRMRMGLQIFTHDLGPLGNYRMRFDWFYLDYRFWDWLGVRAGRTKLPFGLYNESSDIDAARVPVLLPQSMYPVSNREFLLAQTGGEVYGNVPLGDAGSLEYRLYGGTTFYDTADVSSTFTSVTVPYLFGGRLMWQTPLEGLQLGGSVQKLRLDAALPPEEVAVLQAQKLVPADFNGSLTLRIPAILSIGSVEYAAHDLLLASEYSRWRVSAETPALPAVPTLNYTLVSERFYLMGSYHVTPWFTPGFYYSVFFNDVDHRTRAGQHQEDVAATLRFDVNPYWLIKVEGHAMHGTAGLSSALNGGVPLSTLTRDWGVLLLKTTAYF